MNKTNVVLAAMLTVSLLFGGWMLVKNKSDKIEFSKEKSVLLAAKDMLNAEIHDLTAEKKKMSELNSDQKNRIDNLLSDVEAKNKEIQRLFSENAKAKDLAKKVKELERMRNDLKIEFDGLQSSLEDCQSYATKLELDINLLRTDNDYLRKENMFFKSTQANDYLIKSTKKNEKLTAFARYTKQINFSFDFPESHLKELEVKVITPDGKTFSSADKKYLSLIPSIDESILNSSGIKVKKVDVTLKPEKKFKKGMYRFSIVSSGKTVSSVQMQLK